MKKNIVNISIIIFSFFILTAASRIVGPYDVLQLIPGTLPSLGKKGQVRYDTSSDTPRVWNGSTWVIMSESGVLSSSSKSLNYNVTTSDNILFGDSSGGAFTFTMPTEASAIGLTFVFKKTSSDFNAITINDDAAAEITTINTSGETIKIFTDGTSWYVIDRYILEGWNSFTPTGLWTTNTTWTGFWKRVGDEMIVRVYATLTGAPDAGSLYVDLPSGTSIDTSKLLTTDSGSWAIESKINTREAGVGQQHNGSALYRNTTSFFLAAPSLTTHAGTAAVQGTPSISTTWPFTWGAGDFLEGTFRVPISGWKN